MPRGSRIRIADRVAHYLIADGVTSVCWGDGVLADAANDHDPEGYKHPLDRITAAIASCERAHDLFRKTMIGAHDHNGNPRNIRCFWLIGTPRPIPAKPETPHD